MNDIYNFEVKAINGETTTLEPFKGKTMLIVNVASKCGMTPQYKGLEDLYKKYKDKGLVVLGFPCNQFGGQEPGTEKEIQSFCSLNYGVTFPLFAKVEVNGDSQHPLFNHLKSNAKGLLGTEAIKWNFTKFLVSPQGEVLERFAPTTEPKDIENDILKLLNK